MKIYFYILLFLCPTLTACQSNTPTNNFKIIEQSKFSNIDLIINKGLFYKKYNGKVNYCKNSIKIELSSSLEEIKIGSNENYFWYTSTYDPIFYYGNIEDVNLILKEIFNPLNLIEILNPSGNEENDTILGNYKEKLNRKTIIKDNKILYREIYNDKGTLYTINYYNYQNDIPKRIKVKYTPENTTINIVIKDISGVRDFDYSMPIKEYDLKEKLSP